MHTPQILDKHGHSISIGDTVYTPFRGGKHEGRVEAIVTSSNTETAPGDEDARVEAQKTTNPPKVVFHDQKGRRKEHRPQALSDISQDTEKEMEKDMARPIGQRPTASVHQRSEEPTRNEEEIDYEELDGTEQELMRPDSADEYTRQELEEMTDRNRGVRVEEDREL